jgi:hypothetical protein
MTDRPVAADYLATVAARLPLPAELRADVLAELADHVADSIAALEAEGLDRDRAERETLARLGRPEALAQDLIRAHQTRRRLFAGIGGGVYAAGGAWITGIIFGFSFATIATIVALAVGALLQSAFGVQVALQTSDQAVNTAIYGVVSWFAAFLAARAAVRASATRSRRPIPELARWWALLGTTLLALWVLVGLTMPLNPPAVVVECAIPFAFAAGALVGIERPGPRVRGVHVVAALAVVLVPVVALGAFVTHGAPSPVVIESGGALPNGMPDMHFEVVGLQATIEAPGGGGWWSTSDGGIQTDASPASAIDAGGWRDLRFEAWVTRSVGTEPVVVAVLDTTHRSPFAVVPAVREGDRYLGTFHFERYRGVGPWMIFFTGVAPDGRRYRLGGGGGGNSTFRGTVWDWLTAPAIP